MYRIPDKELKAQMPSINDTMGARFFIIAKKEKKIAINAFIINTFIPKGLLIIYIDNYCCVTVQLRHIVYFGNRW